MATKSFFRYATQPGLVRLEWESVPINHDVYKAIKKFVGFSTDYSELADVRLHAFEEFIKHANQQYGAQTSLGAALSVRNSLVKQKLVNGYTRMNDHIAEITEQYRKGVSILALCAELMAL